MYKSIFRRAISAIVILSLSFFSTACGKADTGNTQKGNSDGSLSQGLSNNKTAQKTTITLQSLLSPEGTSPREQAFAQIIRNFTEETGVKVKVNTLPWQEIDPQLLLQVQSGNAPDISYVRDKSFENHMKAHSLLSLDGYISKDFKESDKNDYILWDKVGMYDNHKYAFATSFIAMGLYIRKDLLSKAGMEPPKTWDDFVKVAKGLNSPTVYGYLFGGSSAQPNQLDWMQLMIEDRGGKVLDDKGRAVFDSQPGIDTFKFIKTCVFDSKVVPNNATTLKYDDVTDYFASGRVGMILEGSHRYSRITSALNPENVIVTQIPGIDAANPSPSTVSAWNLAIPKGSKSPDAAWEFIKFFTSSQSQFLYSKISGEIPTRKSVADDPYFKSPEGAMLGWWIKYLNEKGTLAVGPDTFQELNECVAIALQEILSSPDSNVEEIVKNAVKKYNNIVNSKG